MTDRTNLEKRIDDELGRWFAHKLPKTAGEAALDAIEAASYRVVPYSFLNAVLYLGSMEGEDMQRVFKEAEEYMDEWGRKPEEEA